MNTIYFGGKDPMKNKREADRRWAEKHSKTHQRINFYIPKKLAQQLKDKVEQSEYESVSAFLIAAAKKFVTE